MKKLLVVLLVLISLASLAGNVLLYQRYSTQRPLVKVGSETIRVKDYQDKLDYVAGKAVLNKMVYASLVLQAAKEANVVPTDNDVKARIVAIERRNPSLLAQARSSPDKMQELEQDLKTSMALENLTIKEAKVTDEEIRNYYTNNKSLFAVPDQTQTTIVVAKNAVDADTAQSLLKDSTTSPSMIATQPRLAVVGLNGFQVNWDAVPVKTRSVLSEAVRKTPKGEVIVVPTTGRYFIVRVEGRNNAGIEPLTKVKATVERMLRLQKAKSQQKVLAELYQKAKVQFEVARYQEYFRDIENFSANQSVAEK